MQGWIAAERGHFAPWLAVCMAGAAGYFVPRAEPAPWIGPAAGLLLLALGRLARAVPLRGVCWAAAAGAAGFAAAQMATLRAPALVPIPRHAVIVSGTAGAVEVLPQGRRVTIDFPVLGEGDALARSVRIRLRDGDAGALAAGDTLRLRALLMAPAPHAYPGAWDLQRDAFYEGIAAYGYALGPVGRAGVARVVAAGSA